MENGVSKPAHEKTRAWLGTGLRSWSTGKGKWSKCELQAIVSDGPGLLSNVGKTSCPTPSLSLGNSEEQLELFIKKPQGQNNIFQSRQSKDTQTQ